MANMTDWFGQQQKPQQSNSSGITIQLKGPLAEDIYKQYNTMPQGLMNRQNASPQGMMDAIFNQPQGIPGQPPNMAAMNQGMTSAPATSLLGNVAPAAGNQGKGMGPLMALAALSSGASLLGNNNQRQSFAPAPSGGGFSGKLINPYSRR